MITRKDNELATQPITRRRFFIATAVLGTGALAYAESQVVNSCAQTKIGSKSPDQKSLEAIAYKLSVKNPGTSKEEIDILAQQNFEKVKDKWQTAQGECRSRIWRKLFGRI